MADDKPKTPPPAPAPARPLTPSPGKIQTHGADPPAVKTLDRPGERR